MFSTGPRCPVNTVLYWGHSLMKHDKCVETHRQHDVSQFIVHTQRYENQAVRGGKNAKKQGRNILMLCF